MIINDSVIPNFASQFRMWLPNFRASLCFSGNVLVDVCCDGYGCAETSALHTPLSSHEPFPTFLPPNTSTVFLLKSLDCDTDLGCGNNQQLCASLGIEIFHKKKTVHTISQQSGEQ